ncbi:hypothetical protein [Pedobacter sandarakinus]|nr:hypothetical protein [Pedobacter sandarakinus]MCX2575032.1 hypothetical protein [Pedobacter sandarakinus]
MEILFVAAAKIAAFPSQKDWKDSGTAAADTHQHLRYKKKRRINRRI